MEGCTRSLRLFVELYIIMQNCAKSKPTKDIDQLSAITKTRMFASENCYSATLKTLYRIPAMKSEIQRGDCKRVGSEKCNDGKLQMVMDIVVKDNTAIIMRYFSYYILNEIMSKLRCKTYAKPEFPQISSFKLYLNKEFEVSQNDTICAVLFNNETVQMYGFNEIKERHISKVETLIHSIKEAPVNVISIEPEDHVKTKEENKDNDESIEIIEDDSVANIDDKEAEEIESEKSIEDNQVLGKELEEEKKNNVVNDNNELKASNANDKEISANENQQMSKSKRRRQKKKNKNKEKLVQNELSSQQINNTQMSTAPQSQFHNKLQTILNSNKSKVVQQSKIQDYVNKQAPLDSQKQKKLNKREQKLHTKMDVEINNDWIAPLNNLLLGSKDMSSKFVTHPTSNQLEPTAHQDQLRKDSLKVNNDEEEKKSTSSKRKGSLQKFKTPNKRKESNESNSVSSISEQDEEGLEEFNELWTDIKIKSSNYSDSKMKSSIKFQNKKESSI